MMHMTWRLGYVCYLSAVTFLRNIFMHPFETYWRRDVYFLNICNIHLFYRFNRSMALHWRSRRRKKDDFSDSSSTSSNFLKIVVVVKDMLL